VLVASSRRARRELGWQPKHSTLERMLVDAWTWRQSHPNGYGDRSTVGPTSLADRKQVAATAR
jgi:hypothetical protein